MPTRQKMFSIDFIVGVFIIAAVIAFAVLAFKVSGLTNLSNGNTYKVTAIFTNVGDLKVRAPVTMAGVTIGRVDSIVLNPKTYEAVVTLGIAKHVQNIPVDSTANIFTAGLIGANYINLQPGFSEDFLKNGEQIQNTNPALILQNLVGQLLFNLNKGKKDA